MRCIGIDPAVSKPICYAYRRGRIWTVGRGPTGRDLLANEHMLEHLRLAEHYGIDTAVIEDGYVGPNPRTALALSTVRGSLAAMAQQAGLRVRMVAPARWQVDMLSQGGWTPRRHGEIVRQARFRAESLLGPGDWTEDECVAVMLAEWGDAQL